MFLIPSSTIHQSTIGICSSCEIESCPLTLYLKADSHEVPSSTRVSKSQYGGKVPNFETYEIIRVCFIFIIVES
jgi:hypothetical protein